MVRKPLLVPAFAILALLCAAPVGVAAPADPAEIRLDLPANNGLQAHLTTFNGEVNLEFERKNRFVSYETDGEATEAGLKVKFGKLGLIDVAFEPTETRTEKPPKGCSGKPSTSSQGVFVGTIEFAGERGFVRIEETRLEGSLSVYRESEWKCTRHQESAGVPAAPTTGPRRPGPETGPSSLVATGPRCGCFFAAFTTRRGKARGPSMFAGAKFERKEGMEILRSVSARSSAADFVFDQAAGTARIHAPQPFSGSAFFKRRPHGRDLWRGTIEVPVLGAEPFSVRRHGFRIGLSRDYPFGD